MEILIRGGRVIDPAQGIDRHLDVWIVDGKIAELELSERAKNRDLWCVRQVAKLIDADCRCRRSRGNLREEDQ